MRLPVERAINLGLVLSFLVLFGVGAIAYRTNRAFNEASDLVVRTEQVIVRISGAAAAITDAESTMRGFIITGDERFLDPYADYLQHGRDLIAELRTLTADSPGQQRRLARLEVVLAERIGGLDAGILARRTGGFEAAAALVGAAAGRKYMGELRGILAEMHTEEEELLNVRTGLSRDKAHAAFVVIGIGLAFSFLLAGAVSLSLKHGLKAQQTTSRLLERSADEFRALYNRAPCGYHSLDEAGTFIEINDTEIAWLGYSRDELVGRMKFSQILPADARAAYERERTANPATRAERNREYELVRKDGRLLPVLIESDVVNDGAEGGLRTRSSVVDITARRRAERVTAQARAYAESIVDTIREPLVILTSDLRVRSANFSFYRMFLTTPEQTVGYELRVLGGGQWDLPELLTALARVAEQRGAMEGIEIMREFPGLGRMVVLLNARRLERIEDGTAVTLILLAIDDVTERSLATETLRKSQQMFEKLFEHSPDGILLVDQEGHVVRANTQAGSLFRYMPGELNGQPLEVLLPTRYRARHGLHFSSYFRAPATRPMGVGLELFALRANGEEFPVDILLSPVETDDGTRVLAVIRDITERKRIEQMHLQFRALFESLPGLYVVLTPDFTIVGASDAYFQATMTKRQSLIGRNLFEMFPDNPATPEVQASTKVRQSLDYVLASKATDSMAVMQYDLRRPDGTFEQRYWSNLNSPVLGADGRVEYVVHRVEDVTEFVLAKRKGAVTAADSQGLRQRMEQMEAEVFKRAREIELMNQRLRAANDELEAFSYSVSHDLRAPLRHIDGFADMLQAHAAGRLDPTGDHYLRTISEAARKMGRLIDDLLAFSRMGRAQMNVQPVNLAALLVEVRQTVQGEVGTREIEWRVDALPEVEGDPGMLRQVFVNLLSNAVKYTRRATHAVIEVGTIPGNPGSATVYVRDNGAGFDMKYADKLFGVFQRLHTTHDFEGTGVGLAIVRRVIQRHGGRVWAEAKVDEGATFFVNMPLLAAPKQPLTL